MARQDTRSNKQKAVIAERLTNTTRRKTNTGETIRAILLHNTISHKQNSGDTHKQKNRKHKTQETQITKVIARAS